MRQCQKGGAATWMYVGADWQLLQLRRACRAHRQIRAIFDMKAVGLVRTNFPPGHMDTCSSRGSLALASTRPL